MRPPLSAGSMDLPWRARPSSGANRRSEAPGSGFCRVEASRAHEAGRRRGRTPAALGRAPCRSRPVRRARPRHAGEARGQSRPRQLPQGRGRLHRGRAGRQPLHRLGGHLRGVRRRRRRRPQALGRGAAAGRLLRRDGAADRRAALGKRDRRRRRRAASPRSGTLHGDLAPRSEHRPRPERLPQPASARGDAEHQGGRRARPPADRIAAGADAARGARARP